MTDPKDDFVSEGSPVLDEEGWKRRRKAARENKASVAHESTEEQRTTKTLRTRSRSWTFLTTYGTVTGEAQEFPAEDADAILKIATKNGVRLIVE